MAAEIPYPSDVAERRRVEDTLTFLVHCGAPGAREDFFQALAKYLAETLSMDYVCIDRLEESLLVAQTVAVYYNGKFEDNVSYTLRDTPCGDVVGKTVCVFPKDVRHRFPADVVLQEMVAESYVGTTLWSSDGRPIGLIALIGRKPLDEPALASSLLHLVAVRAAGELERREAEAALHRANLELSAAVERLRSTGEELASANLKLRASNESLEARVRERTADLQHRTVQLRALALELTRAEEQERRRVAELIHDHLQPLLAVGRIEVELLNRQCPSDMTADGLRKVDDLLAQSLSVARSLTAELSPSVLYRSGLAAAIQWLAHWYQERQGLAVNLVVEQETFVEAEEVRITLFRSVRELLFNVVKHAGVRTAEVRVSRDREVVRVEVHDNGVGFDVEEVRASEGVSGGFGLFSLRERLDALGGTIEVDSAPGCGTRVVLLAPLPDRQTSDATLAGQATVPLQPRCRGQHRIRVVLVDDHAVVRDGLARALADEPDIEVVAQAADGEEAVAVVRAARPDVVLMDINLPKIDGIEATRRILAERPQVRVVGLSMFDDAAHRRAMAEAGAVGCLDKSAQLANVVEAIRRD